MVKPDLISLQESNNSSRGVCICLTIPMYYRCTVLIRWVLGPMEEGLWALAGITKKTMPMLEIQSEGKEKKIGGNPPNSPFLTFSDGYI